MCPPNHYDVPSCDFTPPPGNVTFVWEPCPGTPLATCRYVDKDTGKIVCIDTNHMPAFGVQCVANCAQDGGK